MKALTVCNIHGCPQDAVNNGRCDHHQKKPWQRPSQSTRVTRDRRWPIARRKALHRAHHRCQQCGTRQHLEVHHRQPVSKGGAEYDPANLQVLCHTCHTQRHRQPEPLVILVGLSGTGKTAIREQLAARLGVPSYGPDEHSWDEIHNQLAQGGVVECARIPGRLARRVGGLKGRVVHITAPREIRADRLRKRGENEDTVAARLDENPAISYEHPVTVDKTVEAIGPPDQIAAALAVWATVEP